MEEDYTPPPEPTPRPNLPDLIRDIVVDFTGFAGRHLAAPHPPLMFIAMWLIGMDTVTGGIELSYIYSEQYEVTNWFYAWIRIIVGGVAMGVFRYWLVGSLFHLVVMLSGGQGEARTSRYILLYALLPASVLNLLIKVVQMLIYQNNYFTGERNLAIEGIFGMFMTAAYVFTIVLCYRGMRALQQTDRRKSIITLVALSIGTVMLTVVGMGM